MDVTDIYTKVSKVFLKNETVPSIVYHYTSPEGLMGIFHDKVPKLYFSQYDSLNDYKERYDIVDFLHGYCDFLLKDGKMSSLLNNAIKNIELSDKFLISRNVKEPLQLENGKVIDNLTSMDDEECYTYICSFSLEEDLLPMWRMYSKTDHYEGFSLGISASAFDHLSCYEKGYRIELKKTIYSDRDKTELLSELLLPMCEHYDDATETEKTLWLRFIKQFIHKNQFTFKNKAFEYEKEIRAILQIPKDENNKFENISERKYRQKNGIIIPYVEYQLPYNAVRTINLAPSIKEDIAQNNLADFLSSKGYKSISIVPSGIPIRSL